MHQMFLITDQFPLRVLAIKSTTNVKEPKLNQDKWIALSTELMPRANLVIDYKTKCFLVCFVVLLLLKIINNIPAEFIFCNLFPWPPRILSIECCFLLLVTSSRASGLNLPLLEVELLLLFSSGVWHRPKYPPATATCCLLMGADRLSPAQNFSEKLGVEIKSVSHCLLSMLESRFL